MKYLECFQGNLGKKKIFWKVSGYSGKSMDTENFSDSLESFQTLWKIFGQSKKDCGKFQDTLEPFQMILKFCKHFGNFMDTLEYFGIFWKNF